MRVNVRCYLLVTKTASKPLCIIKIRWILWQGNKTKRFDCRFFISQSFQERSGLQFSPRVIFFILDAKMDCKNYRWLTTSQCRRRRYERIFNSVVLLSVILRENDVMAWYVLQKGQYVTREVYLRVKYCAIIDSLSIWTKAVRFLWRINPTNIGLVTWEYKHVPGP